MTLVVPKALQVVESTKDTKLDVFQGKKAQVPKRENKSSVFMSLDHLDPGVRETINKDTFIRETGCANHSRTF